jgi:hypothetical protein
MVTHGGCMAVRRGRRRQRKTVPSVQARAVEMLRAEREGSWGCGNSSAQVRQVAITLLP